MQLSYGLMHRAPRSKPYCYAFATGRSTVCAVKALSPFYTSIRTLQATPGRSTSSSPPRAQSLTLNSSVSDSSGLQEEHERPADSAGGSGASPSSKPAENNQDSATSKRRGKVQTFDFTTLAACVAELAAHWVPAKVDQVVQPDSTTLCLKLRNQEMLAGVSKEESWLYLSWHQTHARICIGSSPERGSSAEAFSLASQIHSALRGMVLLEVRLAKDWERIAELRFGPRLGEVSHHLFLEIMGNYSNLALTDSRRSIMSCARQISSKMSSKRALQTGKLYELPPSQSKRAPSLDESAEEWQRNILEASDNSKDFPRTLSGCYQGMSPATAADTCRLAGISADSIPNKASESQWKDLFTQWQSWLRAVEARDFQPSASQDGTVSVLGANNQPVAVLQAVDTYYRMPQEEDTSGKLHQQVRGAVTKALKRLVSRRNALEKQLQQAKLAGEMQKQADLIMANLHQYERGAESLRVQDWDTGEEMIIKLDASISAKDQAEALYKKARRLRRTSDNVNPLLEQADEEEEYLQEIEAQIDVMQTEDPADMAALRQIQGEMVEKKLCKPPPDAALAAKGAAKGRKAKRKSKTAGPDFRQYTSPGGLQVLVGRNNVQNDELSHSVANDSDLWFHAKGWPGSHTLLRLPAGRFPGDEDVQFAANLAAFFSKARLEGKAEVVFAPAKNLNKPKGARPGQVLVRGEQVIVAQPNLSAAAKSAA